MRETLHTRWRKLLTILAAIIVPTLVVAGIAGAAVPTGGASNADALAYARAEQTACTAAQAATKDAVARAQFAECIARAQAEIAALSTGTASPSPTKTTTPPTPSASPTGAPSPTATATPTGPMTSACPAFPAVPDGGCTGYKHTGVTLHDCALPLVAGVVYDSCRFVGEVNVSAPNLVVTRSLIVGVVDYRTADDGSLRGLSLTDVEIDSSSWLGQATIGNNDYSCVRCDVHGGTRGANVGSHVSIVDSYFHDWTYRSGDHQTGIGSNGGAHNVIQHNWIQCSVVNDPTQFGCSAAFSIYGDDAPGNDDWLIQFNRFDSGSSYCANLGNTPAKPYPATNIVFTDNIFGNMFEALWHVAPGRCTEAGPYAAWDGSKPGNVFARNVSADIDPKTGQPIPIT